jgi:hypothetical protein
MKNLARVSVIAIFVSTLFSCASVKDTSLSSRKSELVIVPLAASNSFTVIEQEKKTRMVVIPFSQGGFTVMEVYTDSKIK